MARSHARIHVAIWRNQGWIDLSPKAKLLYLTILSQPRLTLVGSIDLAVARWGVLTGMERPMVDDALAELEDGRYILLDETTDELLIRTFVAHDLDPNRVNKNLAAGFWGAWAGVASSLLRSVVLHETPEAQWEKLEPHAPADAVQTRRSPRLEPKPRTRSEPKSDSPSQPPPSSLLPPVTTHPPAKRAVEPIPSAPQPPPVESVLAARPERAPVTELKAGITELRSKLYPPLVPTEGETHGIA